MSSGFAVCCLLIKGAWVRRKCLLVPKSNFPMSIGTEFHHLLLFCIHLICSWTLPLFCYNNQIFLNICVNKFVDLSTINVFLVGISLGQKVHIIFKFCIFGPCFSRCQVCWIVFQGWPDSIESFAPQRLTQRKSCEFTLVMEGLRFALSISQRQLWP